MCFPVINTKILSNALRHICRRIFSCAAILALIFFSGCTTITKTVSPSGRNIYHPSYIEFRGRTIVIGGYYEVNYTNIPSSDVFEIDDKFKAFYYSSGLAGESWYEGMPTGGFKAVGRMNTGEPVPEGAGFVVFNNLIYMIGGRTVQGGSDVFVSDDAVHWRSILRNAPWRSAGPRINHKLAAFNGMIYLAGGSDYDDLWRSPDGVSWERVYAMQKDIRQMFVFKSRFYIHARTDNGNILYSSADGVKWNIINEFPLKDNVDIVFSGERLFAAAPHSIYTSNDCEHWKLVMNSPEISTPCGMYNNRLYIRNLEGLEGVSVTDDGINWESVSGNGRVSLVPYDMKDADRFDYDDFSVLEFKGSGWIIGESPENVYTSNDGLTWKQVIVNPGRRFLHRSSAAVAAYKGYIYMAGGVWVGSFQDSPEDYHIVMNDVWRSANGRDWELVTSDAPWDKMMSATLVTYREKLMLFGGDRYGGYGTVHQVWETGDGVHWSVNSDLDALEALRNSDIRDSYVGAAVLNNTIYLGDKYSGNDIVRTVDGKRFTLMPERNNTDDYIPNLNECVTVNSGGRQYLIAKSGNGFYLTADFKIWDKMIYSFSDNYRGAEDFEGFTLYAINGQLFMVRVNSYDGITIESIAIKSDFRKKSLTIIKYKSSMISKGR